MTVITFSRQAHSGTRDLARMLAERLGYRYVSRDEVTRMVTTRSGLKRDPQSAESEGRALSLWEQLGEQLSGDRAAYRATLNAVITELAVADNVVIVGHGAGQFLRDMPAVVRVFVVAPVAQRTQRLVAEGADPQHAGWMIEQEDRESAEYLRYLFGIDWLDPHQWDLVINVGLANVDAVLEMLTHYARAVIRNDAERDTLARADLAGRVEQALLADPDLGVARLRVQVEQEAIVLDGEALAIEDRERAAEVVRTVAPQALLNNRIVVHPPTSA